ncbi:hypothetical protein [Trinickia fusca]|uniref:hypothetical protein n=1 Tax=Trinickia fusca TaxID=2419777 RepID=UPI0011C38806|nr:hypothetical protein [Trinickia fusca]
MAHDHPSKNAAVLRHIVPILLYIKSLIIYYLDPDVSLLIQFLSFAEFRNMNENTGISSQINKYVKSNRKSVAATISRAGYVQRTMQAPGQHAVNGSASRIWPAPRPPSGHGKNFPSIA